ncbi:MAG TPA: histidine kinase [Allosphingosinicella sp.]|nr:histidine kinase [Allosphingosinicella sp.]
MEQTRSFGIEEDAVVARRRRRAELILIGAFWAFAVLMLSIRALVIDALPISIMGPRRLALALIGATLCFGMARVLAALRGRSFPERVFWGVLGAFLMSATLTGLTMTINRVILPLPGMSFSLVESVQWSLVWLGYFLAWTGTHLALIYHWESEDHHRRATVLAEMTRDAERAALRYQLNPHFLFNTLNSVASLVGDGRNREAEAMLVNLAAFLRSTLTVEPAGMIPLGEEIALQRLYLEIERARFGDRLGVEFDLPGDLAETPVPALILQPLIENAVRHGLGRSEAPLTIRLSAAARGEAVVLAVENEGSGEAQPGGAGVGLANVAARLRAHFGEQGALEAGPVAGGFRASIRLPRREC